MDPNSSAIPEDENHFGYKKPSKLGSEDDLVAYIRQLEQPLAEISAELQLTTPDPETWLAATAGGGVGAGVSAATTTTTTTLPSAASILEMTAAEILAGKKKTSRKRGRGKKGKGNNAEEDGGDGDDDEEEDDGTTTDGPPIPLPPPTLCYSKLSVESKALIRRVHTEIKHRQASLATNKKCSVVIESLLAVSSALQLLRFGEALLPYLPFVASNRYGSHVAQSWLSLVYSHLSGERDVGGRGGRKDKKKNKKKKSSSSSSSKKKDDSDDENNNDEEEDEEEEEDDEDAAGAMNADNGVEGVVLSGPHATDVKTPQALLGALARTVATWLCAISPHLHALMYDASGTHILRALAGILSGVPTSSLRLGVAPSSASSSSAAAAEDANNNKSFEGQSIASTKFFKKLRGGSGVGGPPAGSGGGGGAKGGRDNSSASNAAIVITAATALDASTTYYSHLPSDVIAAFKEGLVSLVHAVTSLGDAAAAALLADEAAGGAVTAAPVDTLGAVGSKNDQKLAIRLRSKISSLRIESPATDGLGLEEYSNLSYEPTAEEVGAMACDASASPTLQQLLEACVGAAPATSKFLCRRLINWGVEGLTSAERSGKADLDNGKSTATAAADASEKRKKEIQRAREAKQAQKALKKLQKKKKSKDDSHKKKRKSSLGQGGEGQDEDEEVEKDEEDGEDEEEDEEDELQESLEAALVEMDDADISYHWLTRLCSHSVGSRVVEAVLRYADAPLFASIVHHHFQKRLLPLCLSPGSTFVIQRLLVSCPTRQQTDACLLELLPHLGSLFARKRDGVIWHMVAAAAGESSSSSNGITATTKSKSIQHGSISHVGHASGASIEVQRELAQTIAACAILGTISVSAPLLLDDNYSSKSSSTSAASMMMQPEKVSRSVKQARAIAEKDRKERIERACSSLFKTGGSSSGGGGGASDVRLAKWVLDLSGARSAAIQADTGLRAEGSGSNSSASAAITSASLSQSCALPTGVHTFAALLRFHPSISRVFVDSLVALKSQEFVTLCADANASRHIIEPLLELQEVEGGTSKSSTTTSSTVVAEQHIPGSLSSELSWVKHKIYALLRGHFAALAVSRFGCWVVTKTFNAVGMDTKRKATIATEISEAERVISGSGPGGKALVKLLRLEHFRANRVGWEAVWTRAANTTNTYGYGNNNSGSGALSKNDAMASFLSTGNSSSSNMHTTASSSSRPAVVAAPSKPVTTASNNKKAVVEKPKGKKENGSSSDSSSDSSSESEQETKKPKRARTRNKKAKKDVPAPTSKKSQKSDMSSDDDEDDERDFQLMSSKPKKSKDPSKKAVVGVKASLAGPLIGAGGGGSDGKREAKNKTDMFMAQLGFGAR